MAPVSTPDAKRLRQRTGGKVESAPVNPNAYPPGTETPGRAASSQRASGNRDSQGDASKQVLPLGDDVPPPLPVNAHVAPPRRQESSIVPIVLGVAAALAILTLALLFLALQRGESGGSAVVPPAVASRSPQQPSTGTRPAPTTPRPGPSTKANLLQPGLRPSLSPPGATESPPGATESPPGATESPPGTTESPPGATDTTSVTPASEPQDNPASQTDPQPETDVTAPGAATDEDAKPATAPDSPPVDSDAIDDPFMDSDPPGTEAPENEKDAAGAAGPPLTAEQLAQLSKAMLTARAALGELEFRIARAELDKATALARLPEHRAALSRLDQLAVCAERFWMAVRQAMRELRGAEELAIGDSGLIVIVVEVKPDGITIRRNGRNETYLLADMPPGLALAIADRALDASTADAALLKGACLAAMKNPQPIHLEEATRFWEQARQQGAEVDPLLQTLTDTYEWK